MPDAWRPKQSATERIGRAVQSLIPGSMSGRIANAQLVGEESRQQPGSGETTEAIFSYSGTPTGAESPPYYNRVANVDMGSVIVSTRSNPSSPTNVDVMVNGSVVASVNLPSGNNAENELLVEDVVVEYGQQISVKCSSIGSGLSGLTVQVLLVD